MKHIYLTAGLLLLSTISFSQTNLISLTEGTENLGYLGRGLSTTGAWNQTPDILALTYMGRDFAIGGWSKSNASWMGASFYINSDNGNIGIGTTAPETKLNVNVGSGGANGTVGLRIGSVSNYPSLEFGIENDYDGMIRTYGNDLKIYAGNWKSIGATASENHTIYFYTSKSGSSNWSTPKMILNHEGNVGIGTTIPGDYKLAVNGKVRAQEIKVEAATWPDYVFAKSYALPTLQDTEIYIKEKGHLPEIPSAAEVKANGIDLGEMNARLLQKIEELTLHLIEKDKEIKSIKTDYQELRKMIADIKSKKE